MKRFTLLAAGLLALSTLPALTSTPVEKVVCTDLPPARWMSEQQARAQFKARATCW